MISSAELVRRTSASYRQIDYWCRMGVIRPEGESTPGSGRTRKWDEELVGKLRLMAKLSRVFGGAVNIDILMRICERYYEESVDLGDNITLSWTAKKILDEIKERNL